MSYTDGWDRWKVIENYVINGNENMDKLNEFMKKQAELELEYANGMTRLIKQIKDDIKKKKEDKVFGNFHTAAQATSVNIAWNGLLDQMEKIAGIHSDFSVNLDTNLRKTIKYRARDNLQLVKAKFDEVRKSSSEVLKSFDASEKARIKVVKALKDFDTSHTALADKRKDGDKLKADFDKKFSAAADALNGYEAVVEDSCSKQKDHCNSFLTDTLNQIQKDDEQLRIIFIKSGFQQYNELALDAYSKILEANQELGPIFENISVAFDSDLFSKMVNCHSESIGEVKMFEILDYDSERRRVINGETKGMDKDDKELERLVQHDPKEAKKKATAKLKILEKDIEALLKIRAALKLMAGLKPEVVPTRSISEAETMLNVFELKKHILDIIIAKSDGLPPPVSPTFSPRSKITSDISLPPSPSHDRDVPPRDIRTKSLSLVIKADEGELRSPILSVLSRYTPDSAKTNQDALFEEEQHRIDSLLPPKKTDPRLFATVIYDFEGAPNTQEMSVAIGDVIEIVEMSDDGWWRAIKEEKNGVQNEGFIPGNYVELLE